MVGNRKTENWNLSFVNFADTSLFPHLKTDLSAGEPLGTVSPSYEEHLKIRVFRKSPTFEFCSALLRSGEGTQSHMEGPGNHFQGYRPINDTQQADFKVGHLRNALLQMYIHNDLELSNQMHCGLITEDNIFPL